VAQKQSGQYEQDWAALQTAPVDTLAATAQLTSYIAVLADASWTKAQAVR